MIVAIQTNIPGQLSAWLLNDRGVVVALRKRQIGPGESEKMLAMVSELTKGYRIAKVLGLIVVTGPGPFTPVRTGISIANTLAVAWHIPVVGVRTGQELTTDGFVKLSQKLKQSKVGKLIRPAYGRAPNISKPKPRSKLRQIVGQGHGRIVVKLGRKRRTKF